MPVSQEIYYETQHGGLCRKHALNAMFGESKISIDDFRRYMKEYDQMVQKKHPKMYKNMSCVANDFIYFGSCSWNSWICFYE